MYKLVDAFHNSNFNVL